jgi:mono/diheme cytochrome c family protein
MNAATNQGGGPHETGNRASWKPAGLALLLVAVVGSGAVLVLRGPSSTGAVSAGQALFEGNCVECHGVGALGDGPIAASLPVPPPSLLEHLGHHTQAQLIQLIRGGVPPAMPPTSLTEDEVRLVIDHVWTLVPESDVAAVRAMQQQMEMMGTMDMEQPADSTMEMDRSGREAAQSRP